MSASPPRRRSQPSLLGAAAAVLAAGPSSTSLPAAACLSRGPGAAIVGSWYTLLVRRGLPASPPPSPRRRARRRNVLVLVDRRWARWVAGCRLLFAASGRLFARRLRRPRSSCRRPPARAPGALRQPALGRRQGRRGSPWRARRGRVASRPSCSSPATTSRIWSAPRSPAAPTAWRWREGTARRPWSRRSPPSTDLPYACIPSGTRNHFALDLGVDRDDVVGALDAFVDGGERRVDLGEVNGRVFVNNVSLGRLRRGGAATGLPRSRRSRTLLATAGGLAARRGDRPDLRWREPGGHGHEPGATILVSNNSYRLGARRRRRAPGRGSTTASSGSRSPDAPGGGSEVRARRPAAMARNGRRPELDVEARRAGPGRHRRRGGDARSASALPHPARACSGRGSLGPASRAHPPRR